MVFSTSCSPFQNWQARAFFYFARKVRQPGTVTRLVSGCTDQEAADLQKIHKDRVIPLAIPGLQAFEMHVTPAFDDSSGGDQKYWNKPNGLLHWMEESLGFDHTKADTSHRDDDAIVILLDPDMMLLRPITSDVSHKNYVGGWVETKNTKQHVVDNTSPVDYEHNVVRHGHPHAQQYGFGNGWLTSLNGRLIEVVGPGSPALDVKMEDAGDYYAAGPPYVATAKDMHQLAVHWVKFLPKVHAIFPPFMCEMHAYSVAAAHLQLPHKLAGGFMVSDVTSDEDFSFLDDNDKITKASVCLSPPDLQPLSPATSTDPTDSTTMVDPAYQALNIAVRQLPFVLHYCQRYAIGRYFFSKYKLREDMFDDCGAPMLKEPPSDVVERYDWNVFPNGVEYANFGATKNSEWKQQKLKQAHIRNGWLLCTVLFGMNGAIEAYKKEACGSASDSEQEKFFQKTWHFHDEALFAESIRDPSIPQFILDKESVKPGASSSEKASAE